MTKAILPTNFAGYGIRAKSWKSPAAVCAFCESIYGCVCFGFIVYFVVRFIIVLVHFLSAEDF